VTSSTPISAAVASLADVERVVGVWCDVTDPALHSGADAVVAVARLATLVRKLTAKQAAFAERVDACRSHPRQAGSPEDWLARQNGTSRSDAKRAIDTARRMKSCPTTADAFARGDLSLGEADVISGAAAVDPSVEAELVAKAKKSHDLADTRGRAAKVKAAAHRGEDPASRRRRLQGKRRWSEFTEDEMKAVAARFLPEAFAVVAPVIDAYAKPIFEHARQSGVRDSFEAYRADAVLAALAAAGTLVGVDVTDQDRTAADEAESNKATTDVEPDGEMELAGLLQVRPSKIKANVSILIDGIALKRGYATANETCEVVGVGPVDVDWVQQLLPEALVDVLLHDLVDIRAHATTTRYRRRAIETSLKARDRRCVVPGCKRRGRLQVDHRHDFHLGGPTSGANCERLCAVHHYEKTHCGARIVRTGTEWHWYPPAPKPGEAAPPPGSIPWRAPIGEHLNPFDLTDLPPPDPLEPDGLEPDGLEPDDTLPFAPDANDGTACEPPSD
jgi:hypothetical protein